jgi:predicted small metal-binding protein
MKTMTCAQMGGPCDAKIMGSTKDEMMANAMAHLEAAHPEMAADVKAAPKDDPKMVAWNEKFAADWAAAPEN